MATRTHLIPPAFWFRTALRSPRIEGLPRGGTRGKLLDLPASAALPDLAELDGSEGWASVRTAWNPRGMAISVEVRGKSGPIRRDGADPLGADGVQLWIDTRDTRDIHRASKFCHHFHALLVPGRGEEPTVEVDQKPIPRALADAPRAPRSAILSRAQVRKGGWLLELFFTAEALHGFDPETNRRLGFLARAVDPDRGTRALGLGPEFPVESDPSLWATLELADPA